MFDDISCFVEPQASRMKLISAQPLARADHHPTSNHTSNKN
jgi:hypothetical protein